MTSPPSHEELEAKYPPSLRTPLVDWAVDQSMPDRWAPPSAVEQYLVALFGAAEAAGRKAGIVTAVWVSCVPALFMMVLAIVSSAGRP